MRTMVDSTNLADDPAAQLVAYYVDGIYATTEAAVRARFPNAIPVPISVIGSNAGVVGDVEPGCMTIAGAVIWVLMRRQAGQDPTLYVNETYGWQPCRQAFISGGIPEPHWWVADYDGVAVVPAGAIAKQYENPTLTGGHFDRSVVADHWPGVDGVYGAAGGSLGDEMQVIVYRNPVDGSEWQVDPLFTYKMPVSAARATMLDQLAKLLGNPGLTVIDNANAQLDQLPAGPPSSGGSGSVDLSPVLTAIADLKAHPAVVADPAVLAIVTRIESGLKAA